MVLKDTLLTCILKENGLEIGLTIEASANGLAIVALG
jgi:hypothetical protein